MTTDRLFDFSWRRIEWKGVAGLIASSLLLALYARGGYAWALGFVALVPWLLTLDAARTTARVVLWGVLMSIAFVAAVFYWFGAAIGAYTGTGAVPATLVLIALAPLLQPQLIAFALARHLVGRRHGPVLRALAGASAWTACEWLVPKLLGDTLGHGLFPSAVLRQFADVGGVAGITFVLLLVNEGVAMAISRRRDGIREWAKPVALGVAIVAGMAGYGYLRLQQLQAPQKDDAQTLRIAMVQASITDYERLRREMGAYGVVRHVLDTHYALSWSAIRDHGADVLLWSETVYPTTFGSPRSEDGAALDREIQGFVDAAQVPLVFGTYVRDGDDEYNAAVFLEPGRGLLGAYRKTHPFPLTEYVPRWLDHPWLRRVLPWLGTWRPGDGARVLPLRTADGREVNVMPLICLDDVSTDLAIEGARLQAQAIVGMSNDSWFTAHPMGARLHLAVAAFRSVETRLPQVRVATNGPSAIIDDTGQVLTSTPMGDQAVLTAFVSARDAPATLVVRLGDWVGGVSGLFLLMLAVLALWRGLPSARRAGMAGEPVTFDVVLLPPVGRAIVAAMRVCAGAGLLWLALDMWLRIGLQVQSLSQLRLFVLAVVAPVVVAAVILHARKAQARVEGATLVLDQRTRRIEIPLASIAGLRPWRVALPGHGVDLQLTSGQRWTHGLAMSRSRALWHALTTAGAPIRPHSRFERMLAELAEARAAAAHPRFDRAFVKFVLFPLLHALVAFRLHQVIAFGGSFGEYFTFGPAAYFTGFLIWWASWSIGLMLFAAVLRIAIESVSVLALMLRPRAASDVREALEWLGRLAFYVGVPVWLAMRLLPSG